MPTVRRLSGLITVLIAPLSAIAQPHDAAPDAFRIELTPDVLASMGLSGAQAGACLDRLAAIDEDADAIEILRQDADDLLAQIAALGVAMHDDPTNTDQQTELSTAQAQLVTLEASIQTALTQLRTATLAGAASTQVVSVMCDGDSAVLKLPPPYRMGVSSVDEAVQARTALQLEARAQEEGETLDAGMAQVILELRGDTAVSAALAASDANLASVNSAFFTPTP